MAEEEKISRKDELAKKYNINFEELEKEQIKLAMQLETKDKIDFSLVERYGAVESIFIANKILTCIIVCDKNFEILDRAYVFEKVKFPYIAGFRNYREMSFMMAAFEKLNEKPDIIFVSGHGIIHPRLGLASHFGLATGIPTIGVSGSLIDCEAGQKDGDNILKKEKKVGKVLIEKEGSKPMFISPGNNISVESAYKISKELIVLPHKRPEPMHLVSKYCRKVKRELS